MKAEIITIGTELLLGHVVNTNAAFISRELASLGIDIYHQTTVGDNPGRLKQVIQIAESRADLLIFSGGLGPTKDDLTKKILADHLGLELEYNQETVQMIKDFYDANQTAMPESNYNQAHIIEGSQVLANENGMALGLYLEKEDHVYAMVPGVPSEMEVMVKNQLVEKLKESFGENTVLESRTLRFFGTTESKLAEDLDELIENQSNPTLAVYVDQQELTLRITAKAEDKDQAEAMIDQLEEQVFDIAGEYFFAYGEKHLPQVVLEKMAALNQTFAIGEEVTGGFISYTVNRYLEEADLFKGSLILENLTEGLNHFSSQSNPSIALAEFFKSDVGIAVTGQVSDQSIEKNLPTSFTVEVFYKGEIYSKNYDIGYRKNRSLNLVMLYVMNFLLDILKKGE